METLTTRRPSDATTGAEGRFTDRCVMVVGASSGIGREVARRLAAEGARVLAASRNEDALLELARDPATRDRVVAHRLDVTDADAHHSAVERACAELGALHLAYNGAGLLRGGPVLKMDLRAWNETLETNLSGTFHALRAQVPAIAASGGGAIVNVSSVIGPLLRRPGTAAYAASKAGLAALTGVAAQEAISQGVRINALSLGPVDTQMSLLPGEEVPDRDLRLSRMLPAGRVGTLEEAAEAALWLLSDASSFCVGTQLVVDGGGTA